MILIVLICSFFAIHGLEAGDVTDDTAPITPMYSLTNFNPTLANYKDLMKDYRACRRKAFLDSFTHAESFPRLLMCYLDYSRLLDTLQRRFPSKKDATSHDTSKECTIKDGLYRRNWIWGDSLKEVEEPYPFLKEAVYTIAHDHPDLLLNDTVLENIKSFFETIATKQYQTINAQGYIRPLLDFLLLVRAVHPSNVDCTTKIKSLLNGLISNSRFYRCISDLFLFKSASMQRLEEIKSLFTIIYNYIDSPDLPSCTHLTTERPILYALQEAIKNTLQYSDTQLFLYLIVVLLYKYTPDAYTLHEKDGTYYLLLSDYSQVAHCFNKKIPSLEYDANEEEKKIVGVRLSADNLRIDAFLAKHIANLIGKDFNHFFQDQKIQLIIFFAILTNNFEVLDFVKEFKCEELKRFLGDIFNTEDHKICNISLFLGFIKFLSWDANSRYKQHIKRLSTVSWKEHKTKIQQFFLLCFPGEPMPHSRTTPTSSFSGGAGGFFLPMTGGAGGPGKPTAGGGAGAEGSFWPTTGGGSSAGAADAESNFWDLGKADDAHQPNYLNSRIRFYENSLLCPLVLLQTIKALQFTVAKGSDAYHELTTASQVLSGGVEETYIQAALNGNDQVCINACNRAYFNTNTRHNIPALIHYGSKLREAFGENNFKSYSSTDLEWLKNQINFDCRIITQGLINEIIPNALPSETVFGILNAIYFKAQWKNAFKSENIRDTFFYSAEEEKKAIPLMFNTDNVPHCTLPDGQYLILDYQEGSTTQPAYKIMFFKPTRGKALKTFNFDAALIKSEKKLVDFGIPKGTVSMPPIDIIPFAERLGIKGILHSMPLIHDDAFLAQWSAACKITFDENGTTAAAASFAMAKPKGFLQETKFILNQPFVFCIFAEIPHKHGFRNKYVQLFIGEIKNASQIEPITA
jgi:serine protease inhibitor